MADVAVVLHWPMPDLMDLPLDELFEYHKLAKERVKLLGRL